MNQPFLSVYSRIMTNPKQQSATGLWLAHGNEPLMSQWLVDALRPIWLAQGQSVTRIELVSAKTWQEVLAELNSLSLFDPANAIIVTGNHKPDKETQAQLIEFASQAQQGQNDNHLLWITPKQDKRALSAKWAQAFNQLGLIIDCNLYNEQQRQDILQGHANHFGLQLNSEAWQLLMSHTQNHLLSAYQSLWRLSYLFSPQITASSSNQAMVEINAEQMQNGLVSESSYSVFDLSDAMLAGNAPQVVKIIDALKHTDEPTTLVLWSVSQEMRRIQQLMDGKDPQSIGIWRSKQRLYQSAVNRHNFQSTQNWSALLLKCDQSIKGIIKQPAWELLLQLSLAVCGVNLFA
ncbi:DNA polymerase III subunit delta [Psychrobacter sp. HD31]|uniref:DNA polymerase III subunit delta n=1 Tax=Psychrobacter sp. HD31 TaxID=3112003 RepID=UPI003DA2F6FC